MKTKPGNVWHIFEMCILQCAAKLHQLTIVLVLLLMAATASAVTYDFSTGTVSGANSPTVKQTIGSDTIQLIGATTNLQVDNSGNAGIHISGNFSGNFAFDDQSMACETKVTVGLQSGKLFNLDLMDVMEAIGDNRTVKLTASSGGSVTHAFGSNEAFRYSTASDTN